MPVTILRADARALPLPDASVDLIVCSPPYYGLRDYRDGDASLAGQIGAEPTPAEYIAALIDCTREWVRVLKPGGSLFVNLGDKYGGAAWGNKNATGSSGLTGGVQITDRVAAAATARPIPGSAYKSLLLLPERYRIAAVDELGLIARAVVIWSKPNGLPESVTDRVRRSHEDWVHLTREPRYYSAVDEIRQPHSTADALTRVRTSSYARQMSGAMNGVGHPLGALPGSVWEIPTEPLKVPDHLGVDHFAAFPTEWPRRIILGWSPSGICVECGEGRRPAGRRESAGREGVAGRISSVPSAPDRREGARKSLLVTITGEACSCPEPTAPTHPAVVLDPFGGTGTTALVAHTLGRHGITADRSADYCRLARWRTQDPGQLAKAMRVPAPPPVADGQGDLLAGLGVS